jgi:hypothetical protein
MLLSVCRHEKIAPKKEENLSNVDDQALKVNYTIQTP